MTIRSRLIVRFTGLVTSILLLTFVSIYAFCWFFISSDFYRRLDRKANTMGDMLIRHRLDADLIRQLNRIRRDQLPNQKVLIYNGRDTLIFTTNESLTLTIPKRTLDDIRQDRQKDFRQDGYYLSGSRYLTADGAFVVVASAQNVYGDDFLYRLRWALTGLLGLIIGITTLAGWIFAGDALRPVQQIDNTLSHIFPNNRDERLPVRPDDDEISRLSGTINQLLDRVGESFRLQRLFVANVSHELKNPLTQISSQLEVSLLKPREPAAYQATIRSVLDDVSELATLTHELLQLSQVQQDAAVGMLTDLVRVDELAWDIRDTVTALNPRFRVTVALGTLPDDPDQLAIPGNRTLLVTALKNLTENACKFAPDGQAQVAVQIAGDTVRLTVANEGPSIPADEQPYLFEPFYRSRQTADQVRGYGVGLSLVEQIVRLHRGRLSVRSEAGSPTVFTIELPRL